MDDDGNPAEAQQGLSFPDPVVVYEHCHQNITGGVSVGTLVSQEKVLEYCSSCLLAISAK